MKEIKITTPLRKEVIGNLKAGDVILITGKLFTARDLAHQLLCKELKEKKKLPFKVKGQIIYYTGPTQKPQGKIIGACGPTTSSRMDKFTPPLLKAGLLATMGKGQRSKKIIDSIRKSKSLYLVAPGGCGAYLSKRVKKACVCKYKELGPEAIYCLEVKDFPAVVAIDSRGRSIYKVKGD